MRRDYRRERGWKPGILEGAFLPVTYTSEEPFPIIFLKNTSTYGRSLRGIFPSYPQIRCLSFATPWIPTCYVRCTKLGEQGLSAQGGSSLHITMIWLTGSGLAPDWCPYLVLKVPFPRRTTWTPVANGHIKTSAYSGISAPDLISLVHNASS
jgi:hypothetical protein